MNAADNEPLAELACPLRQRSVSDNPLPITGEQVSTVRPKDAAYNPHAVLDVGDLIERYHPDALWNDRRRAVSQGANGRDVKEF